LTRIILMLLALAGPALADQCLGVDPKAAVPFAADIKSGDCHVRMSQTGFPLPDAECTPGAANPTLTVEVLRTKTWTTKCVRNSATTEAEKRSAYAAYGIVPPKNNKGVNQTCELDHLCSLEHGCADTLDNIWPQCDFRKLPGTPKQRLAQRWFKIKDAVENYLAREIKAGRMEPEEAQHGIAEDWSQYVPAAAAAAPNKMLKRRAHRG
jgi:hypothetical protein